MSLAATEQRQMSTFGQIAQSTPRSGGAIIIIQVGEDRPPG